MQLTLKGDYAVRVVVDLAAQPPSVPVRTEDLRRRTGIPPAYLSKIIQTLARKGLVRTRRGARGGVSLLPSPQSISLRQVIEAVEGPLHLNRCLVRPGACPRDRICAVHPVWARIQALLTRELDAVRVQDLVDHAPSRRLTAATRREATR